MTYLSRLEPKGARSKIYAAAVRLFSESGAVDVNISELAQAAGIARGTIYNNVPDPDKLFKDVANALAREMLVRTEATMRDLEDPVERVATGMRLFVRRAHQEQDWGRFLVRYALNEAALHEMMSAAPVRDLDRAIAAGLFKVAPSQLAALASLLTGATLAAMNAAIRGEQTWRDAGSGAAELVLRAGRVTPAKARAIAQAPLPDLALPPSSPRKRARP